MVFNKVPQNKIDERPVKTGKYTIVITPLNGERAFTYRDPASNKVVTFDDYTEAAVFGHDLCVRRMWTFDVNYRSPR